MPIRSRPRKHWSLNDTYDFIAAYFNPRSHACPKVLATIRAHRVPSRSISGLFRSAQAVQAQVSSKGSTNRSSTSLAPAPALSLASRRDFHNYFVTHLPSSSLHPDSGRPGGPHHKLPRDAAAPHIPGPGASPAASPPNVQSNRELTVVRIPLRSAKHHFGAAQSRGQRPYNEDTNQAGTIDMPAFAKRQPISLVRNSMKRSGEGTSADSAFGDPQVFYFGVFDGHGGNQCSDFLRDELHGYIEEAATEFELKSSLRPHRKSRKPTPEEEPSSTIVLADNEGGGKEGLDKVEMREGEEVQDSSEIPSTDKNGVIEEIENSEAINGADPKPARVNEPKALKLQKDLVREYKETVGGYFRRFSPPYFTSQQGSDDPEAVFSIESVLTYAFLRADLDFVTAQAHKPDPEDAYVSDSALNKDEVLGSPHMPPSGHRIGGNARFKGGSTASVALISTPTPAPFWHPAASSTLLVAHVGDTRVLLCETATGLAKPLTSDHHPSTPGESHRLRRFAASFVTDSFGEERIQGLANSRAFGDIRSKRLGVSAEPEITRTDLSPAEYSFLVLMSDGVSGTLSDQEVVDVVKEARTPEQASRDVVSYATEVTNDGDNATCVVVRLGGWERRSEGGLGSLGTKEIRDYRRNEALDPRRGRR